MRDVTTPEFTTVVKNGFTYLHTADGRVLQVPSGGRPEDPPPDTGAGGDDGEGDGKGGDGGTRVPWNAVDWESPAAPKLTEKNLPKPIQEVLNRVLAKDRREHGQRVDQVNQQLREEADRRQGLETKVSELETAIAALTAPPPDTKDPLKPPADIAKHPHLAQLWVDMRKSLLDAEEKGQSYARERDELRQQLNKLTEDLGKERETRSATEQKAINARRDREILAALADLDVIEPKRVLRLYTDDVVYDQDTDSFAYRTADGELVDLADGLAAAVPAHFVRATTTTGGSGAHGGNGTVRKPAGQGKPAEDPTTEARAKLTQERNTLNQKRATAGRLSPADHARIVAIGRELDALGPAAQA